MYKDDVLSEILKDVSSNWEDIQYKFKKQEKEKKYKNYYEKNKNLFSLPDYDEFYNLLMEILNIDINRGYDLQVLVHRILKGNLNGRLLPESFKKIWNLFCGENRCYSLNIDCICGRRYTVLLEGKKEYNNIFTISELPIHSHSINRMVSFHCFNCNNIYRIGGYEKIVGLVQI